MTKTAKIATFADIKSRPSITHRGINQANTMNLDSLTTTGNYIYDTSYALIASLGISEAYVTPLNMVVMLILLAIVLWVVDYLTRRILVTTLTIAAKRTKTKFDDYLIKNKTLSRLAHVAPLIVALHFIPTVLAGFPGWIEPITQFIEILLVITWVAVINAFFNAVGDLLRERPAFHDKPIGSYVQVAHIFVIFIGGIVIFTMLTGNSPWAFLGAMGAASAILMLVFKDTIMGFVASIQVSTNDMIRVGDWIEMPKFNADGDVLEINLNTVKIRNWDKTITTVPTHYLITEPVKNWRGMHESGGRRIKRAIHIKISTIRYLEDDEIHQLKKIQLLAPYIEQRQTEIEKYNKESGADRSMPVNGRKMTNVGLYRRYITEYTTHHPLIHKDYTMLVRQLEPTQYGLPIELYMYTSDTKWGVYENAMADIFDHLLASVKYFGLEIFEAPASDDIRQLRLSNIAPEAAKTPRQAD